MLGAGITLFVIGLLALAGFVKLIYVIVNRIRQIDKEDFPDREN